MIYLFLIAIVIIGVLVFIMFMILKNTVNKINVQTKSYFVDKLQEYDDIISEKEEKLNKIDEEIKEKELKRGVDDEKRKKVDYEFDYNIIDLFNKTRYQDNNFIELSKKIDDRFNIDYVSILKRFVSCTKDDDKIYNFCLNLRGRFDADEIYKIKLLDLPDDYLRGVLSLDEYRIYDAYKMTYGDNTIEGFINYLEELIDLNNPTILVYVGNVSENYDYLDKNIRTKYEKSIYRGIKVIYKNKIYDFSLSERNV